VGLQRQSVSEGHCIRGIRSTAVVLIANIKRTAVTRRQTIWSIPYDKDAVLTLRRRTRLVGDVCWMRNQQPTTMLFAFVSDATICRSLRHRDVTASAIATGPHTSCMRVLCICLTNIGRFYYTVAITSYDWAYQTRTCPPRAMQCRLVTTVS